MTFARTIASVIILVSLGVIGVQAQNVGSGDAPAEFPPASFKGKQYVDSRGCVCIRAGIDGNVTWVPRVGRDRKLICGAQPSLSTGVATAPAAPRTSAPPPEQITIAPTAQPRQTAPAAAAPQTSAATTARRAPSEAVAPTQSTPRRTTTPLFGPRTTTAKPPSPGPEPTVVSPRETVETAPAATPMGASKNCPVSGAVLYFGYRPGMGARRWRRCFF